MVEINEEYLDLTSKNLTKFGIVDGVSGHCGDSLAIAKSGEIPVSQFVLIDADHSLQGVKRDVYAYWPLLSNNGLLILHDSILWNGVRLIANLFATSGNPVCTLATSGGSGISIVRKGTRQPFSHKK